MENFKVSPTGNRLELWVRQSNDPEDSLIWLARGTDGARPTFQWRYHPAVVLLPYPRGQPPLGIYMVLPDFQINVQILLIRRLPRFLVFQDNSSFTLILTT